MSSSYIRQGAHICLKMSLSLSLLLLLPLLLRQPVLAQPYRDRYRSAPRCTDGQTGRELLIGDSFTRAGQCVRVQCLGSLDIWEDRCQTPKLSGNCSPVPPANEFLDYPKCCPLYECKAYEEREHGQKAETRLYDHYGNLKRMKITEVLFTKPMDANAPPGSAVRTQFEI